MEDLTMNYKTDIKPFDNCPPLDGYHCQTNSLAKIFYHHHHPLSEDMFLGLGAGMGFIYWKMKSLLYHPPCPRAETWFVEHTLIFR